MSENSSIRRLIADDILIYGLGSHALLCYYYLTQYMGLSVRGFCISNDFRKSDKLSNLPVFDYEDIISNAIRQPCRVAIGVGYQKMNQLRADLYLELTSSGITVQNVIGLAEKQLEHVNIGNGLFVDHGSMIHPFVHLGNNVSVVTSNIGHHSTINDNSFISGATIGGNVVIGKGVFIGMNAVVKDNVTIGDGTFIGMGSIVNHDTEPYSVYSAPKAIKRNIDSRRLKL